VNITEKLSEKFIERIMNSRAIIRSISVGKDPKVNMCLLLCVGEK